MLAAISHDLRTPITRMKLRTQLSTDKELYEKNMRDLAEMEEMVTQTLAFARQDPMHEKKVNFDIFSLLATICDEMMDLKRPVEFSARTRRIALHGQPLALKRAFTNLINNAVKYANTVTVRIQQKRKTVIITVEDDGPGIPEKDFEKMFEPFYRGEHSRSRHTGGVGLGLATTRDIIHAHDGHIKLANKPEGGLVVTVTLPIHLYQPTWHCHLPRK